MKSRFYTVKLINIIDKINTISYICKQNKNIWIKTNSQCACTRHAS